MPLRQKTVPHDGTQTISTMFTNPVKRLLRSGNPRNRQQVRDATRNPKGPARSPRGAGARKQAGCRRRCAPSARWLGVPQDSSMTRQPPNPGLVRMRNQDPRVPGGAGIYLAGRAEREFYEAVCAVQHKYDLPQTGIWDDSLDAIVSANARGRGIGAEEAQALILKPTSCGYCKMDFNQFDVVIDHGMHPECWEWVNIEASQRGKQMALHPPRLMTPEAWLFLAMAVVFAGFIMLGVLL